MAVTPFKNFVHLHTHSHYSLLDGGVSVPTLVDQAVRFEMPALAITDHGNLCGALEFSAYALKQGLKPIIGIEAYVAKNHRDKKDRAQNHLILLAMNFRGYQNLVKLSSRSHVDGFYYKPRIDHDLLAEHHEGLIVQSACIGGEVPTAILNGDLAEAERIAGWYREVFGDRYYFELQDHGLPQQQRVNDALGELAAALGIPTVVTNDCHYHQADDAEAHDCMLCIATASLKSEKNRFRFETDQFYFKSQAEMAARLGQFRDGLHNTYEVAERCERDYLPFGEYHLPQFPDVPEGLTDIAHLRERCEAGLATRYGPGHEGASARLAEELAVIEPMGFASYFLIVADFCRFARESGVRVGPGRGSAAGSIVAYALSITDVDPLKYDLLFERFLNRDRISMPDIDIDFDPAGRERVIQYVRDKYGTDRVAQIITFGSMKARAVIRDVGRVLDVPLRDVDALAKKVPAALNITLAKAWEQEPELRNLVSGNPVHEQLWENATRLEGLVRHASTHAAGVIIGDAPLEEYVPRYRIGDDIVTQYSMEYCERIGLLKMDFLGLRNLAIVAGAERLIGERHGAPPDWQAISFDDPETYAMLARGEALGVFQLESSGMRELLSRLKPDHFGDLIAVLALYRPGPLESGMVDTYVAVKHKEKPVQSLHPSIDPILAETNGVILYQEQVMRLAATMGGFTLSEADTLRKAMGKKKAELMAEFKGKFIEGAVKQNIPAAKAAEVFDLMAFFAGYGFNKSHSTAYAVISFQTAWLRAHYPVEYFAALLTSEMGSTDKMVEYLAEARRLGLAARAPDINEGRDEFGVNEAGEITFGLAGIRGVGRSAIAGVVAEREENGPFTDVLDLVERIDLRACNKGALEALARAGALDRLGGHRRQLVAALEDLIRLGNTAQRDRRRGQKGLFGGGEAASPDEKPAVERVLPKVTPYSDAELLAGEKETIGFYLSSHPLARYADTIERFGSHTTAGAANLEDKSRVLVGGMLTDIRMTSIKQGRQKGRKMALCKLEDLTGALPMVLFADAYEASKALILDEAVVFAQGRVEFRGDEAQIVCDRLIPVGDVRAELTRAVHLHVVEESLDDAQLARLVKLVKNHPGRVPVFVELDLGDHRVTIKAGPRFCVRPSDDFTDAAVALLEADAVRYQTIGQ